MALHQQGFDRFPVLAGAQFLVCQAALDVDGGVEIGVRAVAADHAAKRLLVGSVGAAYIVAHAGGVGGVSALNPDGGNAPLGGIPGDLFGEVRQVGGVQIGIHGTRFVLHSRNREVFVGDLRAFVLSKTLVDRAVDLLAHMAGETLPASAFGGGQLLDPFLL